MAWHNSLSHPILYCFCFKNFGILRNKIALKSVASRIKFLELFETYLSNTSLYYMDRFISLGKLRCFSIFAKKNKIKNECPLSDADLHALPSKMTDVIDREDTIEAKAATDISATEIISMACSTGFVVDQHQWKSIKELSDQKDSMIVKVATALLTAEDTSRVHFSSRPIIDQNQTISVVDLAETQLKGLETDTDVILGPEIVEICSETPVEFAYEGGDEQAIHSSSRELSDNGSQRNMDGTGSSEAF